MDLKKLENRIIDFRNQRDWEQFHNPKDVALSLVLEATEVLEHFQWRNNQEVTDYCKSHKDDIGEEIADVFYWLILMSHDLGIDLERVLEQKIEKNEAKYPVEKAKGNHKKYNEL